jgi:hypothetical protein
MAADPSLRRVGSVSVRERRDTATPPLGSSRPPRHPVRFPCFQPIPTSIPGEVSPADPNEIMAARPWTDLARSHCVRRGQPRRSCCSISVVAGPRYEPTRGRGLKVAFQSLHRQGGGNQVRRHRSFAIASARRTKEGGGSERRSLTVLERAALGPRGSRSLRIRPMLSRHVLG